MSRQGWTTIAIPTELYNELQKHVPTRAKSVQEYIRFWARVGDLVDRSIAGTTLQPVIDRLLLELWGTVDP